MSIPPIESMPAEPKKNRVPLIIGIVLIVLCCCCIVSLGLGKWLWDNGDSIFGISAVLPFISLL